MSDRQKQQRVKHQSGRLRHPQKHLQSPDWESKQKQYQPLGARKVQQKGPGWLNRSLWVLKVQLILSTSSSLLFSFLPGTEVGPSLTQDRVSWRIFHINMLKSGTRGSFPSRELFLTSSKRAITTCSMVYITASFLTKDLTLWKERKRTWMFRAILRKDHRNLRIMFNKKKSHRMKYQPGKHEDIHSDPHTLKARCGSICL